MFEIQIRKIQPEEVDAVYKIESAEYHPDEAATLEKLKFRLEHAQDYFWGAYIANELVGYVCGTLSKSEKLTHESMSNHEPDGETLCIHSVCVTKIHQRKGIALYLLRKYIEKMKEMKNVKSIALISHDHFLGLYTKAGLNLVGESDVTHGPEKWYECRLTL